MDGHPLDRLGTIVQVTTTGTGAAGGSIELNAPTAAAVYEVSGTLIY